MRFKDKDLVTIKATGETGRIKGEGEALACNCCEYYEVELLNDENKIVIAEEAELNRV